MIKIKKRDRSTNLSLIKIIKKIKERKLNKNFK